VNTALDAAIERRGADRDDDVRVLTLGESGLARNFQSERLLAGGWYERTRGTWFVQGDNRNNSTRARMGLGPVGKHQGQGPVHLVVVRALRPDEAVEARRDLSSPRWLASV
jgi:hypothetical protein